MIFKLVFLLWFALFVVMVRIICPMVIFKGKRLQKGDYPQDVIVRMNKDGWMTENLMTDWLDTVWGQRVKRHGKKRFFSL